MFLSSGSRIELTVLSVDNKNMQQQHISTWTSTFTAHRNAARCIS